MALNGEREMSKLKLKDIEGDGWKRNRNERLKED